MPEQVQQQRTKKDEETAELEYKDQRDEELLEETDELLENIDSLLDSIEPVVEDEQEAILQFIVVGKDRRLDLAMAFGGCGICHLRPGCPYNGAYLEAIESQ
mgnify:FL=1